MTLQLLYRFNCFQNLLGSIWEISCVSIITTCILLDSFLTFWNQLILKLYSQLSWFFDENPAEVFVPRIFQLLYWFNCFQNLLGSNWEISCMPIVTSCFLLDSFLTFWNQLSLKLYSQFNWFFDKNPAEVFVLMIFQVLYWSNCFQIFFGSNWGFPCISIVNPWTLVDSSLTLWI